ncbi:MAG TPA: ATP-binding protein [Dissulfurispiraceae bacterium]
MDTGRNEESKWEDIFNALDDAITIHDDRFNVIFANKAAERLFGLPAPGVKKEKCYKIYHGTETPPEGCLSCRTLQTGMPMHIGFFEGHLKKYLDMRTLPRFSGSGEVSGVVHIVKDMGDRRNIKEGSLPPQEQLAQSKQMETLGMLASGVVHDFNNLLTNIIGNTEVALGKLEKGSPVVKNLKSVLHASENASELVRQILDFSRNRPPRKEVMDINRIVEKEVALLSCVLGKNIDIFTNLYKEPLMIECDPVRIGQVAMNLALNARDAMPGGGKLIITTSVADFPGSSSFNHIGSGLAPQRYVLLSIADTGKGMHEEIKERVFEPFFTTKDTGRNTGLGLSIVRNIIKQHDGYINMHSEPGSGTSFGIYFPEARPGDKNGL